jgi:hypoxanthine phosphoribosyltransferase
MMKRNARDQWAVMEKSEEIVSSDAIQSAILKIARQISVVLAQENPFVLCVMRGAVVFCGHLLTHLRFPLDFGYVHATRYHDDTHAGALQWLQPPPESIRDRHVLLVDDILDEGDTLASIAQRCRDQGAQSIRTAVVAEKYMERPKPHKADFIGFKLPNRYVFGFGMDIHGYWRNLPSIRAVKE